MTTLLLALLRLYQRTISPDHGVLRHRFPYGFCRFYPTCSDYAYQAISRHGAGKGGLLAAQRLLRCHPWHAPAIDHVPQ